MMKGKQVALEKDFNPRASYYMGDPLRFRQVRPPTYPGLN
jgi:hypothetical protein